MAFNPSHCAACGSTDALHEHHLVPRVLGGLKLPTVTLCIPCHRAAHGLKVDVHHTVLVRTGKAQAKAERESPTPKLSRDQKTAQRNATITEMLERQATDSEIKQATGAPDSVIAKFRRKRFWERAEIERAWVSDYFAKERHEAIEEYARTAE